MGTIQSAAIDLVCEFSRKLPLGLRSPASFVKYYNDDDDVLRLEIEFSQHGGGADPDSEPYRLYIDKFNFYKFTDTQWEWVDPNSINVTIEDFNY